ncbi:MAG: signal recognition particle-docking protein FtsY [Candidatus Latescibacterota bacterium]|nr:signal recognition particle-docking protein FtsY [Candidatus Latescibacterota bacterium]
MLGGVFGKFSEGLGKTREVIRKKIAAVVSVGGGLDESMLEEIEATLIQADMGLDISMKLVEDLRASIRDHDKEIKSVDDVMEILEQLVVEVVDVEEEALLPQGRAGFPGKPFVVLVVGVNGAGKTTTVGKLAKSYADAGQKVLVAACDTFRAGAVAQLDVWADRAGVDIVRAQQGADPASVAYDAVRASVNRGMDVLLVDTAGRLQNKTNLMEELKKIQRSIGKQAPQAPHETLLVLDATNGQNALSQAREFHDVASLTGIVLTKLDGTAKGGIVVALRQEMNLPVKLIGVGEGVDDLQPFDGKAFSRSLFID